MAIGEDRASIQRHIDDLQTLAGQRNPDQHIVKDKLRRTFSFRKVLITEEPLDKILDTFPILKSARQVTSFSKLILYSRPVFFILMILLKCHQRHLLRDFPYVLSAKAEPIFESRESKSN